MKTFDDLLSANPAEEAMQYLFEKEPAFLMPLLGAKPLCSQVRLGDQYVCDFATFSRQFTHSQLDVTLVEIEPPGVGLFTKAGDPTAKLTHGIRQVNDWLAWCDANEAYVKNRFFSESSSDDHLSAVGILIIGRRNSIPKARRATLRHMQTDRLRICTYDRIRDLLSEHMHWHGIE